MTSIIPYVVLTIFLSIILLKKYIPYIFWNKDELGNDNLLSWKEVFTGITISKKKITKLNIHIPQCKSCFMSVLNSPDLAKDTIVDPTYADYNVIGIKVKNEIIFVCKKHKIQIEKHNYKNL